MPFRSCAGFPERRTHGTGPCGAPIADKVLGKGSAMSDEAVLQVWEGYIESLDEGGFTARLLDVTAGSEVEDEEARVPWASIPGGRPGSVREGTYLRWRILQASGGRTRSDFAFDIAGTWGVEDLAQASARASDLSRRLRQRRRDEAVGLPPPRS